MARESRRRYNQFWYQEQQLELNFPHLTLHVLVGQT